ncbi:uncharacterized protein BDR25DRAFT_303819 [Lindgomyces ingoldianus]|uniref:Uncharacterized protein n=1 Tax=Lindgomyces ingoldianus TaxID=673940 RepID=A0ACB6QTC1_9PLEO|nr:uncharacterized protein BDR25DRAFT_303819 [Lindgomyces ingoldianus]KAF2470269.1 hypothetical protein BDR25DRAFT_303819 [Lindgomyces ingoldianus]
MTSPPQQAEHIRGKTLTPESPKPVHYPSPSNIPILETQMDPTMFNDAALNIGTPASYQSYPHTQTPSAQSSTSYYPDQQPAQSFQNVAANGAAVGAVPPEYSQSTGYNGSSQTQDTSIHNFASQISAQAPAPSYSEAKSTPVQDSRSLYPMPYESNAYPTQQPQSQPATGNHYHTQTNNNNNISNNNNNNDDDGSRVNYQALFDHLSAPAANSANIERYATPSVPSQSQGQTPISSLPAPSNLPPRPPPQEKPVTHPNYNPNDDIRSYHPHSQNQKPQNSQFRSAGQLQPLNIRPSSSNPPLEPFSATRSNQSPSTPGYGHRQSIDLRSATPDDEDARWPPEINKLYEEFLEDERKFVTDGQWDQFPMGSRLFIGNLPTEKVTKRDIFHRFYRHGKLAQISIKQAYGFVQFLDSGSCYRALHTEQGQTVRGRKMHLEISKPQRNTKKADGNANDKNGVRRRSRSPDYTRGGTGSSQRNMDRYSGSQSAMSPRDRDNRRFRDDYRPIRSPSPQRGSRGMRGRNRSPDRYDGRRRSRSRSPRRYRSRSPRRDLDDDLPLPRRAPHQIPEVQVLVVNEGLPRDFIRWVEDSFRQAGLQIDVLILSPRLSEPAVVRRQILEGVLAIVRLNTATLAKSKVNLQVFDRRGGADNIKFNEYADLEPTVAAALVINAKQDQAQAQAQTQAPPVQPVQPTAPHQYGQAFSNPPAPAPSYTPTPHAPNQYPPTPTSNAGNLSNLISSLDPNGLQQLLGAISQNGQSQPPQPPPTAPTPDLARLLGSVSAPPTQTPAYPAQTQYPPPQTYPNTYQNPTLASLLGSQPPVQPAPPTAPIRTPTQARPTGQPDMNEIMAQLARYQR